MNLFKSIEEFHQRFQLNGPEKPSALSPEQIEFRTQFLYEELHEYQDATVINDLEGQLDALVDLVYVALGTAYLHGFDFNEAFRRVHAANMGKVRAERQEDSKRGSTFDVVKPEGWTPPDLSDLVK